MKFVLTASLVAATTATTLLSAIAPAQSFSFTSNVSGNPPTGNIILESIVAEDGMLFTDFVLIETARILTNPAYTGGNSGAASSDRGDEADGIAVEDPTAAHIVASLGNLNLNNIIDTEDQGYFTIDLGFAQAVNYLFVWERGQNSRLGLQALDAQNNPIGQFLELFSGDFGNAGFSIDTTEIAGPQPVGSRGIRVSEFGITDPITGIRVSAQPHYNGPDFKIVGASAGVPEPTTMLGLALAGAGLVYSRRRRQGQPPENTTHG